MREYHDWVWTEGEGDEGYPHAANKYSPAYPGFDFDAFYAAAANASIAAACEAASADDPIIPSTDDAPMYDPDGGDDGGCFVTMQSSNNCYNYGTDVLTNSFAQPGVGSGQAWWPKEGATPTVAADEVTPLSCPPWCGPANNCSALAAAAARDGLSWHGNVMPADEPERGGHHVALFVWPESNFHWIRMDADVDAATGLHLWSHKPGGSPVTNVDNNGDAITDPRAADFSPWYNLLTTPGRISPPATSTKV